MIKEAHCLRVLITGISGLIGIALKEFLEAKGHEVIGLSHKSTKGNLRWDPNKSIMPIKDFEGIDVVINLAGETIAQYWTKAAKERIYNSRIISTKLLVQTILEAKNKPKIFISASACSIYQMNVNIPATETSESVSKLNFLNSVIHDWEEATWPIDQTETRRITLRLGNVLSQKGGILSSMLPIFKWGFGGYLGSGEQLISWIDIDDVVRAIYFCILNKGMQGLVNIVSPNVVSNREFSKALGKVLKRPVWLAVSGPLLKLILGEELAQEVILRDVNVYPKKLLDAGFEFKYSYIEESLNHLLDFF